MAEKVCELDPKKIFCIATKNGVLGRGSYGLVRLAFHDKYGPIAVKCSEMTVGGYKDEEQVVKRIKNEIGRLQDAKHQNVVRAYGWSFWPGAIAIVMEYLPAGNLKNMLLNPDLKLSICLRLRFAFEIAEALAFIHSLFAEKRLVHGDVKPENVILSNDLHCKLADFGGATLRSYTEASGFKSSSQTAKSDPSCIQYTLLYAAPETLRNPAEKPTTQHDVYSFAITMHMILSLGPPLPNPTYVDVYLIQVKGNEERPSVKDFNERKAEIKSQHQLRVFQLLEQEMLQCWKQNPKERPYMKDVRDRLEKVLLECNVTALQQEEIHVMNELQIKPPSRKEHRCFPLDTFLPPHFESNEENYGERQRRIESSSLYSASCSDMTFEETQSPNARDSVKRDHRTWEANSTEDIYETISPVQESVYDTNEDSAKPSTSFDKFTLQQQAEDGYEEILNQLPSRFVKKKPDYYLTPLPKPTSSSTKPKTGQRSRKVSILTKIFKPKNSSEKYKCDISEIDLHDRTDKSGEVLKLITYVQANLTLPYDKKKAVENITKLLKIGAAEVIGKCESIVDEINYIITAGILDEDETLFSLITWCMSVCDNIPDRNKALQKLQCCVCIIHKVATAISKQCKLDVLEHAILPLLLDAEHRIKHVPTFDHQYKTEIRSWALIYLSCCNKYLDKTSAAMDICKKAHNKMIKAFGEQASTRPVVATCYRLMAELAENRAKSATIYDEAKKYYKTEEELKSKIIPIEGIYETID